MIAALSAAHPVLVTLAVVIGAFAIACGLWRAVLWLHEIADALLAADMGHGCDDPSVQHRRPQAAGLARDRRKVS